jgi:hypothetical protein
MHFDRIANPRPPLTTHLTPMHTHNVRHDQRARTPPHATALQQAIGAACHKKPSPTNRLPGVRQSRSPTHRTPAHSSAHVVKRIENVAVGDRVWAWNEDTGQQEPRRVTRLFRRPNCPVLEIVCTRASDHVQRITATTEHPFWVDSKGWVVARELTRGDLLKCIDADAPPMHVNHVHAKRHTADVFNFEVEDVHSYFVGGDGVLVHNHSGPDASDESLTLIWSRRKSWPWDPSELRQAIPDDGSLDNHLRRLGQQALHLLPRDFSGTQTVEGRQIPNLIQRSEILGELVVGGNKYGGPVSPEVFAVMNKPKLDDRLTGLKVLAERVMLKQMEEQFGLPTHQPLSLHYGAIGSPNYPQIAITHKNLGRNLVPFKLENVVDALAQEGIFDCEGGCNGIGVKMKVLMGVTSPDEYKYMVRQSLGLLANMRGQPHKMAPHKPGYDFSELADALPSTQALGRLNDAAVADLQWARGKFLDPHSILRKGQKFNEAGKPGTVATQNLIPLTYEYVKAENDLWGWTVRKIGFEILGRSLRAQVPGEVSSIKLHPDFRR